MVKNIKEVKEISLPVKSVKGKFEKIAKKFAKSLPAAKKIAEVKAKPSAKAKPEVNPSLAYCPKQFGKVDAHGNQICLKAFEHGTTKDALLKKLNDYKACDKKVNERRIYKAIWRLKQIGKIVTIKNGVYKLI